MNEDTRKSVASAHEAISRATACLVELGRVCETQTQLLNFVVNDLTKAVAQLQGMLAVEEQGILAYTSECEYGETVVVLRDGQPITAKVYDPARSCVEVDGDFFFAEIVRRNVDGRRTEADTRSNG